MSSRVEKHRSKRKWPYWVGGIFLALILLVGGFAFYMWDQLGDTVETMHDPLERDSDPGRQKELEAIFQESKSLNVLLLGVDSREGDGGRSDTMILLSLNPQTDSMLMFSIPRDTYVNIPGYGMDKINHAYAFGDVDLSVQTVEEAFDLPVHYYARVNMEGFQQGIDSIGGVTVANTMAFSQGGSNFPEGQIRLNGSEALDYIRMRQDDPRGDLGRNERQREVVQAALKEGASFSNITKAGEILDILGGNVKTDLNMNNMQSLFGSYRGTPRNATTLEINGTGERINDIWYYIVSDEELSRITSEVRNHMEAS